MKILKIIYEVREDKADYGVNQIDIEVPDGYDEQVIYDTLYSAVQDLEDNANAKK